MMSAFYIMFMLILILALQDPVEAAADCVCRSVLPNDTCPRTLCELSCKRQSMTCKNGTVYHCAVDLHSGEIRHGCAKERFCQAGTEPRLSFFKDQQLITEPEVFCMPCRDMLKYNPQENTSSVTFSDCPYTKENKCEKTYNKIQCGTVSWKDSKHRDGYCRCDARRGFVPENVLVRNNGPCFYADIDGDIVSCIKGKDCPNAQQLLLNYTCAPVCPQGFDRTSDDSDDCLPEPTIFTQPLPKNTTNYQFWVATLLMILMVCTSVLGISSVLYFKRHEDHEDHDSDENTQMLETTTESISCSIRHEDHEDHDSDENTQMLETTTGSTVSMATGGDSGIFMEDQMNKRRVLLMADKVKFSASMEGEVIAEVHFENETQFGSNQPPAPTVKPDNGEYIFSSYQQKMNFTTEMFPAYANTCMYVKSMECRYTDVRSKFTSPSPSAKSDLCVHLSETFCLNFAFSNTENTDTNYVNKAMKILKQASCESFQMQKYSCTLDNVMRSSTRKDEPYILVTAMDDERYMTGEIAQVGHTIRLTMMNPDDIHDDEYCIASSTTTDSIFEAIDDLLERYVLYWNLKWKVCDLSQLKTESKTIEQKMEIQEVLMEIRAIYKRSNVPLEEKPQIIEEQNVSEEVIQKVLSSKNTTGCGIRFGTLVIFMDRDRPKMENKSSEREIADMLKCNGVTMYEFDYNSNKMVPFKICSGTKLEHEGHFGTLGGFVKRSPVQLCGSYVTKEGNMCVLLANHVAVHFLSDENGVVKIQNGEGPIKATILQSNNFIFGNMDIAVAEIDTDSNDKCETRFRDEKGRLVDSSHLYDFDENDSTDDVPGQLVHIWGATSAQTPGLGKITIYPYFTKYDPCGPCLGIQDRSAGQTFCKPGDSGAIVLASDIRSRFLYAIGMVSGSVGEKSYVALQLQAGLQYLSKVHKETFTLCNSELKKARCT